MASVRNQIAAGSRRRRFLPRGESAIASAGLALAALLLCAMSLSAGWAHHAQQFAINQFRDDQVRAAGETLAHAAQSLLANDQLTATRRLIADAGRGNGLAICRILLPDGRVIASSIVAEDTLAALPGSWPSSVQTNVSQATAPGEISRSFAMEISGHGAARLTIVAPLSWHSGVQWQLLAGLGGTGAWALLILLVVYRRMRRRLRAVGAVREALAAIAQGETSLASLSISSDLGPEAAAWNGMVAQADRMRRHSLAERAQDVLGRRQESRGELDAACDALPQGLLVVDETGKVKYANGAAAAFLNVKREELIGAEAAKLLHIDSVVEALKEVASGAGRRRHVLDIERKDEGASGVLRFIVRPVRREDPGSAMVLIEDITQQKAAEQARHRFVAQATHELRTPLTNIRLYVETAIDEGEHDPATRSKCLNVINGEARRLERIVGEMLSVAEIEAGSFKLNTDDVRLDQLFEDIKADFQQQAQEKHIALAFHLPPKFGVLRGDRDKILLALHNLVGNALKYTPDGGRVDLIVDATEKQFSVQIRDTGIGIPEGDRDKIFDRFYRANDPRVAKITGTGLGLTLAREVVRLHGGDIVVESRLNEGSTFTLTLPVAA
ncbi:MAG TPA: ATP-binding protein [Tepidisphaeraceae bacterium]|nr:ATP-binding protein [Tepidisphaeraceae bacterium]